MMTISRSLAAILLALAFLGFTALTAQAQKKGMQGGNMGTMQDHFSAFGYVTAKSDDGKSITVHIDSPSHLLSGERGADATFTLSDTVKVLPLGMMMAHGGCMMQGGKCMMQTDKGGGKGGGGMGGGMASMQLTLNDVSVGDTVFVAGERSGTDPNYTYTVDTLKVWLY